MVKVIPKCALFLVGCLLLTSVVQAKQQPTVLGLGKYATPSNLMSF